MTRYDVLIRNGTIYDGSGAAPFEGDLAISGDMLSAVGPLPGAQGIVEIDARGLAVAPGFINMLSHAQLALLVDGRSHSDIHQGVTLEVMGEGQSAMGPLSEAMKRDCSGCKVISCSCVAGPTRRTTQKLRISNRLRWRAPGIRAIAWCSIRWRGCSF